MVTFDLHADTLMAIVHEGHRLDGSTPQRGQVDIPRLRRGGVDAQLFVVFVTPYWVGGAASRRCHALIDRLELELSGEAIRSEIALARTVEETRRLRRDGRLAALLAVEGGHVLVGDPGAVEPLANRGVRYLTMTWVNANEMADSSGSPPVHGGLSAAGRETVRNLERAGVLVDVSHASEATFWDVARIASEPMIASHSCCRALDDHPRNLTDEQLRAVAATGGVVGIAFHSAFLGAAAAPPTPPRWRTDLPVDTPELEERRDRSTGVQGPDVPLARLVDHFLHALEVAGPDHVALGSDFDGRIKPPVELPDVAALPALRAALRGRGIADQVLDAVWGGNVERVLGDADRRRDAPTAWGR